MCPIAARADASTSALLTFLLIGGALFSFGYARAVWVRATKDYRATKAAVKPLQKAMWTSMWKAIKVAALVVIIGICLIVWFSLDIKTGGDEMDKDVPSPTPSASATHRH
jgi:TRAP-type C4-dicarboxylate transport system permease large subunit